MLIENLNFSIKDITLNAKVGDFLTKLSIYEQKEISWGFYVNENSKEKNNALIYVASYEFNTPRGSLNPVNMYYGNYRLYWNNHTHPDFSKNELFNVPSDSDLAYARMAKKGNYIWSTIGVSQYDKNGTRMYKGSDLTKKYNEQMTKQHVKENLGWKKRF